MNTLEELLIQSVVKVTNLAKWQVENVLEMHREGATIPFMSRYRKERTGNLDEVQIETILKQFKYFDEFEKRRASILESIKAQGKLTPELKRAIEYCSSATELEDLYLPYKQKRKRRASQARELGLEPLAVLLLKQQQGDVETFAERFLTDKVTTVDAALKGARDIIAEEMAENAQCRQRMRSLFAREGRMVVKGVKGKEEEGQKFKDFFAFEDGINRLPAHRLLAILRGANEGFLSFKVAPSEDRALDILSNLYIKGRNSAAEQVQLAAQDSYKRLLQPSLENETIASSKAKADEASIVVFADNLKQLLMAAPVGSKRVLAIDPGFRTGCKVVVLNESGDLVHNETIYPHAPQNQGGAAMSKLSTLCEAYKVEAIAIGNGTASRETEELVKRIRFKNELQLYIVSEAGASIYSASPIAREELPQFDVTVRGSVSIGRRLQDPMAELVKIDPKSIGVGQYQHDVDQAKLQESLDRAVESSVNAVGVNLNNASKHLLKYVSGLGPQLAQNIVDYRASNGAFQTRAELSKVPRLGPKAFEQAAGFLRIPESSNPLDNSAVHPESYSIVTKIAKSLKTDVKTLVGNKALVETIDIKQYVTKDVGESTLSDILLELKKPGRDPRKATKILEFDKYIKTIDDLKEGQILPGIVTNITAFGVFVDVGVKQDGLVHISHLANQFVSNPLDVIKLHQHVKVKVLSVDSARKRIAFSIKDALNEK